MEENQEPASDGDYEELYEGICLRGQEDEYLFLPPDQKPSEEDESREAAGELYISYGSVVEERCVYMLLPALPSPPESYLHWSS